MIETDLLGTLGNDFKCCERRAWSGWNLLANYVELLGNVNLVDRLGIEILNKNSKIQMRMT